jgi:hypothetical protein
MNWLARAIAKFGKEIKIPTGYQNETGFHLVSNLPKGNSSGSRFDEACDMNLDAGLHTDTPPILSIRLFEDES